jgi:hypothetical protein
MACEKKAIELSGKLAGEAPQMLHPNEFHIALGIPSIIFNKSCSRKL